MVSSGSKIRTVKSAFRRLRRSVLLQNRRPLHEVPDVRGKVFVFLGGLHRSGTSILHRVLRAHPSVSGFSKTGVQQDEGQHLQTVFPSAIGLGGPGRFAFYTGSHLTEESACVSESNTGRLLREWGAYLDLSKKVYIEKSPPNLLRARMLQALVPGSRFVFVVRHPLAVSLATQKWSKTSLVELLLHWFVAHSILASDLQYIDNALVLRYEDFVRKPELALEGICAFVGIDTVVPDERIQDRNESYLADWAATSDSELGVLDTAFPSIRAFARKLGYRFDVPYCEDLPDATSLCTTLKTMTSGSS